MRLVQRREPQEGGSPFRALEIEDDRGGIGQRAAAHAAAGAERLNRDAALGAPGDDPGDVFRRPRPGDRAGRVLGDLAVADRPHEIFIEEERDGRRARERAGHTQIDRPGEWSRDVGG